MLLCGRYRGLTVGIEGSGGTETSSHDRCQTEGNGDVTNTITGREKILLISIPFIHPSWRKTGSHPLNITERRPLYIRRNPKNILNNLPRPPKLRYNLLVHQRRQAQMTPRMQSNLMALQMLALQDAGELEAAGADGEGGVEGLFGEEGEEVGGVERGAVVVGETPGVLVGAGGDVDRARAAGSGPPAAAGVVVDGGEIGGAATFIDCE
jgi:hypothetical protein